MNEYDDLEINRLEERLKRNKLERLSSKNDIKKDKKRRVVGVLLGQGVRPESVAEQTGLTRGQVLRLARCDSVTRVAMAESAEVALSTLGARYVGLTNAAIDAAHDALERTEDPSQRGAMALRLLKTVSETMAQLHAAGVQAQLGAKAPQPTQPVASLSDAQLEAQVLAHIEAKNEPSQS